jgi:hypothetical protein
MTKSLWLSPVVACLLDLLELASWVGRDNSDPFLSNCCGWLLKQLESQSKITSNQDNNPRDIKRDSWRNPNFRIWLDYWTTMRGSPLISTR